MIKTKTLFSCFLALALLAGLPAAPAFAQAGGGATEAPAAAEEPSEAAVAKARELGQIMGLDQMGEQMVQAMSAQMRQMAQQSAQADPAVVDAVIAELEKMPFLDMAAPIWARNFTMEELDQLIEFYQTPLGEKLAQKQPQILTEMTQASQMWAQQTVRQVMAEQQQGAGAGAAPAPSGGGAGGGG